MEHDFGIIRDTTDNYMPQEYSSTLAGNMLVFPRIFVKLPARIVDEYAGGDGSATFEIETNLFDESTLLCSIDEWATTTAVSGGQVSFTDLSAGVYSLMVRHYRGSQYFELRVPFQIYNIGTYGTKYVLNFKDNFNDENYSLRIRERGFSGTVTEICGSGTPVRIEWGFDGSDEIYGTNVMPSKCTLQILVEEVDQFQELFTETDIYKYKVEVIRGTGLTAAVMFQGWIVQNTYQVPIRDVPYYIQVIAHDGFGVLSGNYASYGNSSTGRLTWNHDKITISELLWAIRREMRLGLSATPSPTNSPGKIIYHDHLIPVDHDTAFPALYSETVNLKDFVSQDGNDPTTLMELLETVLAAHFVKVVPYEAKWYVMPIKYYESDIIASYLQYDYGSFLTLNLPNMRPSVDGINAFPDHSWRNNDQVISLTPIYGNVKVSHSNKYEGLIDTPYRPWIREYLDDATFSIKVGNNDPGWFVFYKQDPVDNPSYYFWNLLYNRVNADNPLAIYSKRYDIPGYMSIEPKKLLRYADPDIRPIFTIKFTSITFDMVSNSPVKYQLIAGGYYLRVISTDPYTADWQAINFGTDTMDDFTNIAPTTTPSFIDNTFTKSHTIVTPPLPAAFLDDEHFVFRVVATGGTDYDVPVLFIDDLKITAQFVKLNPYGENSAVDKDIYEYYAEVPNEQIDDSLEFKLPYWNGASIEGCITTKGNPDSMPTDATIQDVKYGPITFNRVEYWLNQINRAYAAKRNVIDGSISEHIAPFRHPVYNGDQYILSSQSYDLKANQSVIKMVELPLNYQLTEFIGVFDTELAGNHDYTGAAHSIAFRIYAGASGATIDWGDGSSSTASSGSSIVSHTYASAGTYTVTVNGSTNFALSFYEASSVVISGKLIEIIQIGSRCQYVSAQGGFNEITSVGHILQHEPIDTIGSIGATKYVLTGNNIPTSNINSILSELTAFTVPGILYIDGQSPSAPPSGAGVTDLATLVDSGWEITIDS